MNSLSTKQIKTDHKDLIQDIAFDFYGKRVATASLDHSVRIWYIDENNEWIFKEELKINPGLYRVAWAHPEFGSLIAVACDRLVWIYEEASFSSGRNTQNGWVKRSPAFSDAKSPITDLKFAPKFLGLQLAICSQNGEVRIYECSDIGSNVWTLVQLDLSKTNMNSCSSCSWSNCMNLPVLLALGSDETTNPNTDKLAILECNESNRNYTRIEKQNICNEPIRSLAFAPSIGKLYHTLAIASKSLMVVTIKPHKESYKYQITTATLSQNVSAWRVCWNTTGSVLASAGDDRKVRLWRCNYAGSWVCYTDISGDSCLTLVGNNFSEYELANRNSDRISQQIQENEESKRNNNQMVESNFRNAPFTINKISI